jgi:hypothetical protein
MNSGLRFYKNASRREILVDINSIERMYSEIPEIYTQAREGLPVYFEPIENKAEHGTFLRNNWFRTRNILIRILGVTINNTGHNTDDGLYSMDVQFGKRFNRFYFENLGDRIIFRINDDKLKHKLKEWLSIKFENVSYVGDNELLQIVPLQNPMRTGIYKRREVNKKLMIKNFIEYENIL